ncbi:MAG: thioredoxin-disulfide reductase, partial [Acidimicrobiales bacterium]
LTTDVENYPGFPSGIMGPELMSNFRDQAERFGAELLTKKVTRVNFHTSPFEVWVGDPSSNEPTFTAKSIIVSTGAKALMLNLPKEIELVGHGISTCATCDGFFFKDQEIAVVGGGDSAIEEAMFLSRFASKVTIIHRRDQLRASKIMQDRAFANPKIKFLWNHQVTEYIGDTKLEGVKVQNVTHQTESTLNVSGLFIAIGHTPNTSIFEGQLSLHENGYIKTESDSSRTNIDGVFACGDVQDFTYRQAITAAGSGCMAAIDAERWLEEQHAG